MAKRSTTFADAYTMMRDGRGRRLMQMHTVRGQRWFIVPGFEIPEDVALALIMQPQIQPGADGLFPGHSQTYKFQFPKLRLVTDAMRAGASGKTETP